MNNLLQLKGQIQKRPNKKFGGPINLAKNQVVTSEHIQSLIKQLEEILIKWEKNTMIGGALITAHYRCVVAKSNRIQLLLKDGKNCNDGIRGVKFDEQYCKEKDKKILKHVFTYFISCKALEKSIDYLKKCDEILIQQFNGKIGNEETNFINNNKENFDDSKMARSTFLRIIVDANYIEFFNVDELDISVEEQSIVTIFRTELNARDLFEKYEFKKGKNQIIDNDTLLLNDVALRVLQDNVPYLIAMAVNDLSQFNIEESFDSKQEENYTIAKPTNEPLVGVIDTQFDERVYFTDWVDYVPKLGGLEPTIEDFFHGTSVTSIIVDGPKFNPKLDDGCGKFKVRHFGVALNHSFSSLTFLRMIEQIVSENTEIKVWNLSLGSPLEIKQNFISPEAAALDEIQNKYDVIFIVAGTNKESRYNSTLIGSPADSLNSIVVNAVDFNENPASYSRKGPVLSFFYKPDVSYYGGDVDEEITVYSPFGERTVRGTSYAAPWITRKVAYLIHKMGLSREIAKALIIDSAAGWKRQDDNTYLKGYGIVPVNIKDVIYSKDDEIKFILSGTIDEYETYTYNLPIPQDKDGFPFYAKATLAYFPKCERNQGVDYTSTEMDLHFGRLKEDKGKVVIKSIDNNIQDEAFSGVFEEDARKLYRKWDNVKHICEVIKNNPRSRKAYSPLWGLSIKTKERLDPKAGRGMKFGVVVTLKEMNGVNRIDDFINMCILRGWLVNQLNVENQVEIYNLADNEIEFE